VQCLDALIDPAAIPRLLPFTFMCTVLPDGIFTIRLAGEELLLKAPERRSLTD
jgi:hypothetical protein